MPRYLPISTPSRHIGGARDGDDLYGQRDDIHFIKARIAGLPTQKGYLSLGWPPFPAWHSMSRESASALVEIAGYGTGGRVMARYRIYFFGVEEVIGRHDFEADGDPTAVQMAQALFDVCSDTCQSFDLWRSSKHISVPRLLRSLSFAELSEVSQERVIQTEEQIAQSAWLVAKSRRLLEYLEANRARRPAAD